METKPSTQFNPNTNAVDVYPVTVVPIKDPIVPVTKASEYKLDEVFGMY